MISNGDVVEHMLAVREYLHEYWDTRRVTAVLDLENDKITMNCTVPWVVGEVGALIIRAVSNGTANIYDQAN